MKIIQSNFGTIKVIDPVVPDSRTTAQGTYGKYATQIASGGRVKYQGAGLVDHGPAGVRQGFARVGGNPEFGKTITGAARKGTVLAKTQPKLDLLKELIDRENSLYRKNKDIAELLNEAGWKGGWDSVPTSGETRKLIHKYKEKLLTTQQKMDNYVNNVMLAEDAVVQDFRNPKQHLAKKFGVSKSFMDKWSSPDHYNSKVYKENKKLFQNLSKELSFNKYKTLADGTPRLMHDYSIIIQNKLPSTQSLHRGSSREKFILESAHRHNKYAKHAGISSQVTFINKNYELLPMNQWQFIKNGKLYSLDPSIDTVEFRGETYKNNYLNRVDAAKLYKKDFGEVYKVFDELDVYMDTEVINPKTGKPIKLDKLLQERAHKLTGKKGYYKRRFMDIDHADIMKNPFGELRLLDATTNKRAGIIKRLDKYKNNPELLKKTLDDIGYNRKFNNTDELIKFYSGTVGAVPKVKSTPLKKAIGAAKYIGKTGTKIAGTVLPVLAPAAVGLGLYDMERARAEGMDSPLELGTAYYLGPEVAKGYGDIKKRWEYWQDPPEDRIKPNIYRGIESLRPRFKYGGTWKDWILNHEDQMTFEEYLKMDIEKDDSE